MRKELERLREENKTLKNNVDRYRRKFEEMKKRYLRIRANHEAQLQ